MPAMLSQRVAPRLPLPTKNTDGDKTYIDFDGDAFSDDRPVAKQVYELITNSPDVIKGYFCGHNHGDAYTEIKAKTPEGKPAYIPQYVLANMSRRMDGDHAESTGTGNLTRIILK